MTAPPEHRPEPAGARRPIRARGSGWARRAAQVLAAKGASPDAISIASMAFAALAGLALALSLPAAGAVRVALLLAAIAACALRLVCNLLDGMVAVEHGRAGKAGPFWNEVPDRVSDLAILAGAGFGAGAPSLGFAAGASAVMTAYVRALGESLGAPADFSGPLAKQQRMWVIGAGALLACAEPLRGWRGESLALALAAVIAGAALTALFRARRLLRWLKR